MKGKPGWWISAKWASTFWGSMTWRKSLKGRPYLHVEPSQKSRQALRDNLGSILNHWTRWKTIESVVKEANRVLRDSEMSIKRRGEVVDRLAAVLILQSWMEARGAALSR